MPTAAPIALLGTGLLGGAIAERLLRQGYSVQAWNRSPARLRALETCGALACASPAAATQGCGWVITVLSDASACRQVLLEQPELELAGLRVVQMGTIGPWESQELAESIAGRGGRYLEAPVLGSRPEALAGRLQVMAAGPAELFAEALPLLRELGPQPIHLGPVGRAMHTKLALNQLIASLTHAFSLSLQLVQAAGVERESFLALLRGSALHAPTFDKKLPRMVAGDYANPNFPTAHLRKDLNLFLQAAQRQGLHTEGLAGLAALLERAAGSPLDGLDYSALHELTGPCWEAESSGA